jgi:hypothetical protein
MWSDLALRDVAATERALRAALEPRRGESRDVGATLDALSALDDGPVAQRIASELEATFRRYVLPATRRSRDPKAPLGAIVFRWVGGEVEPYVPTDVVGSAYSGFAYTESEERNELELRGLEIDSSGGFGLAPVDEWLVDLASRPALGALGVLDPLVQLLVARTLRQARLGLERAVLGEAFRALGTSRPFAVFARPGHDEPAIPLLRLEA